MSDKIVPWALGLIVSLVIGHCVTRGFVARLHRRVGCTDDAMSRLYARVREIDPKWQHGVAENEFQVLPVSPALQGLIERFFFTVLVAFDVSATAAAMMGWLAVKMVTNLNRSDLPAHVLVRTRALTGLLGAMVSMTFALIGGLICRLSIPLTVFEPLQRVAVAALGGR